MMKKGFLIMTPQTEVNEKKLMLEVDGVQFPAVLSLPEGTPEWGMLLIPGSLFVDVDGNLPQWGMFTHAYADLARQLSQRGAAVLRFAKWGPGTGSVTVDEEKAKAHGLFGERVVVAKHAFELLQSEVPHVSRWAVMGHSEGAVVGSLLCHEIDLDAYVNLSGPAHGIFQIMTNQTRKNMSEADAAAYAQALEYIRRSEAIPAEVLANPTVGQYLAPMDESAWIYLRSVDVVNPQHVIAKVPCPVLIVQGEEDESVAPDNADLLFAARQGKNTTMLRLPNLTHMYKVAKPGLSPMELFGITDESDSVVADGILSWLTNL
jgi:uncharacterized protein